MQVCCEYCRVYLAELKENRQPKSHPSGFTLFLGGRENLLSSGFDNGI